MEIKNYIDALKTGKSYDFICNHGHEFSKDDLIYIIKELDYAIYSEAKYAVEASEIYEVAARNMEEFMEFEESCVED